MDKPFPIILLLFSLISGLTFFYIYAFEAANINRFIGERPTAFLSKTKLMSFKIALMILPKKTILIDLIGLYLNF